jgi:hypothetical protein
VLGVEVGRGEGGEQGGGLLWRYRCITRPKMPCLYMQNIEVHAGALLGLAG